MKSLTGDRKQTTESTFTASLYVNDCASIRPFLPTPCLIVMYHPVETLSAVMVMIFCVIRFSFVMATVMHWAKPYDIGWLRVILVMGMRIISSAYLT